MKKITISNVIALLFLILGGFYAYLFNHYLESQRFVPLIDSDGSYLFDKKYNLFYYSIGRGGYYEDEDRIYKRVHHNDLRSRVIDENSYRLKPKIDSIHTETIDD